MRAIWIFVVIAALPPTLASAVPNRDHFSLVMETIEAICPISSDPDANHRAHMRAQQDGIAVVRAPVTGFGTHADAITFGEDYAFDLHFREGVPGFCSATFDDIPRAAVEAALTERYGPGTPVAEGAMWTVHRADGDGAFYYRPHVAGQTGPAWVVRGDLSRGEYVFAEDASRDFLAFYLPDQRPELDQLDHYFAPERDSTSPS